MATPLRYCVETEGRLDREQIAAHFGALMVDRYGVDFAHELFDADPDIAGHAAREFGDVVFHQGDIYPGSADAALYLGAALEYVGPGVRAQFIHLLGGIATALHAAESHAELIAKAASQVTRHWSAMEEYLRDPTPEVRIAALVTLTDLARVGLDKMNWRPPTPPYVEPLRRAVLEADILPQFRAAIDRARQAFGSEWQAECDHALALLSDPLMRAGTIAGVSPHWAMLDRDVS